MKNFRPGVAAVVFRRTQKGENKFLLLHRIQNWRGYEFVKGGIQGDESDWAAIEREVKEEAGLRILEIKKTPYRIEYKWPAEFVKDRKPYNGTSQSLFIAEVKGERVKLDHNEHDNYKWVTAEKALKYLTWKNQKKALKYVLEHYF